MPRSLPAVCGLIVAFMASNAWPDDKNPVSVPDGGTVIMGGMPPFRVESKEIQADEAPVGHYLQERPQYFPTSPPFPLKKELASMEEAAEEERNYETAVIAAAHHFAREGQLRHLEALLAKHPTLVDAPEVAQEGKPGAFDDWTMLHHAVARGQQEVVALLLQHGANVNLTCGWDWTPLHLAAESGNVKIAKLLIQHAAKRDAKTKAHPAMPVPSMGPGPGRLMPGAESCTPLDVAIANNRREMVEYLRGVAHGPNQGRAPPEE